MEEWRVGGRVQLRIATRAVAFLPRRRFDVIHCHFGDIGERAAQLARLGVLDGPIVTSFHGYDVSSLPRAVGPNLYRELFVRGAAFVAVSGHVRNRLLQLNAPPDKTLVIRLGIDLERFRVTDTPGNDARPTRLVSVGRMVDKKGHDTAIRAVVRARALGAAVELTVIGDGPKRAELEALIAELDCSSMVSLLGAAPRATVQEVLGRCHAFLMASRTAADGDQEGLPVALMEAMARGLPVVATRHGAIPELVEDGVSGLLADEDDVEGLATSIARLARSPSERRTMGRAARVAVSRQHDATRQLDELERLYRTLA